MRIAAKVLDDIWDCSAWLVKEVVKRLDRLFYVMLDDASAHNMKREEAAKYFAEKLLEVINEVAENRESDKQQARRQQKEIAEWKKKHDISGIVQIVRPTAKARAKREAAKKK